MNNTKYFLIYVILTFIFFSLISCQKLIDGGHCKNMPQQIDGGTGEIINNVLFKPTLSYSKEEQIITSDSLNIFGFVVSFDNGETYNPVDFSQYSILGKYAAWDGCMAFFDRNVTKDAKKKKYIYTIRTISCGNCMLGGGSSNWVLIPKIEDGFAVEFVVEHTWWKR